MKVRQGFVSNSSSSSFIVIGQKPENLNAVKIDPKTAKTIITKINKERFEDEREVLWDGKEEVWITSFVSDCRDAWGTFYDMPNFYVYLSGAMSEMPYDFEEDGQKYHINLTKSGDISEDVYISKSDYNKKPKTGVKKMVAKKVTKKPVKKVPAKKAPKKPVKKVSKKK